MALTLRSQGEYLKWCSDNSFESMLPRDAKARLEARRAGQQQARLDSHLKELPLKERIVPYNDELFREAAVQWLVQTDQARPLQQ